MKHKVVMLLGAFFLVITLPTWAQPASRSAQTEKKAAGNDLSVRAQTRYPGTNSLPNDVVWTREIYRTLDLNQGENGALYYPVEPMGDRMNFFSLIFKLLATKKIHAYEYQLDGVERLTPDNEVKFKDILDRFGIYYEQRKLKNVKDSVMMIDNSDIPSADVLSYFIKEVWYFDHRTSTFGSTVTAICPVLHRAEDFSMDRITLPMFWVNYNDLVPYLNGAPVMASDYNHVTNRNMSDFFTSKQYKGDIYKTTNLRNQALAQYCETDSALVKEQQRIENELVQFERNLYGPDLSEGEKETTPVANAKTKQSSKKSEAAEAASEEVAAPKTNSKKKGRETTVKQSNTSSRSSSSSGAPKASVRRERR